MMFAKPLRERVRSGRIRCSVRIWTRPHVKVDGRYQMDDGHIVVDSVEAIELADVTHDLARESGFDSVEALLQMARHGPGDNVFLIRFHYLPPGGWVRRILPIAALTLWVAADILASQGSSSVRTFETAINLEATSEDSANVSMGDLDGDGDLDLVLAKGRHTPILDRVLLNDGNGGFTASDLGPTPDRTYTAALADLDNDGDLDVLTSNDTPDRKLVFLNDGKGRFSVAGTWGVAAWSTRNAAVADLNGDGKVDVIAANRPGPSFVCLNDGDGRFTNACTPIPAASATTIAPADFDKDGFIDLAVPSRDGGQSQIYFNDGKAGFARTAPFGPADAAARVGAAADFNRDGSIDLAIGDEKTRALTVYINDGRGRLTPGFRVADSSKTPYAMLARDLNDDGHPDIVFGYTAGPHAVFFNDGTGQKFRQIAFGDKAGSAYGFAVGDVNGDKVIDIAMARSGAPNVLYLGAKLTALAPVAAQRATSFSERVAIGSRSLWLTCTGVGKPTVLLEAGHGETSETWAPLVPQLSSFTRVCSYDRAGLGQSDPPGPGQRTGMSVVTDLHALLVAARETGPFVMVGHSLGGAFVRLYANAHPENVAAMVLVDVVHERDFTAVAELLTPDQRTAGAGMRPASPEGLDIEAVLAELGRARSTSAFTFPLLVLARGRPLGTDEMPQSWSPDQRKRREELRRSLQADLATLSKTGALITALRSGHFIHHDEPALVTSAIRQLVEGWRRGRMP